MKKYLFVLLMVGIFVPRVIFANVNSDQLFIQSLLQQIIQLQTQLLSLLKQQQSETQSSNANVITNQRLTPVVTLTASPTSIVSDGKPGTVKLSWTSSNADACYFEKQTLATAGSINVLTSATATYSISCTGPGGSTTSNPVTVKFNLTGQQQVLSPTVTLFVNPTLITSDGKPGTATLGWSSSNATSCAFEKQTLPTSGSINVLVSSTASYNISCTGPGGTATSNQVKVVFKLN